MYEILEKLSSELSEDLQKKNLAGCTIGIKLKTVEFEIKTRVMTVSSPTNDSKEILDCSRALLDKEIALLKPETLKLRLMGVRVSGFGQGVDELNQTDVSENKPKRRKLQSNIPSLVEMFNHNSNSCEPSSSNNFNFNFQSKEETGTSTFRNSLSQDTTESTGPTSSCPICSQTIKGDNDTINRHIDSCLNKRYIRDELSPCKPAVVPDKQGQLSIQSFCTKAKKLQ